MLKKAFRQDGQDSQDKMKIFKQIGDPDLVIPAGLVGKGLSGLGIPAGVLSERQLLVCLRQKGNKE